jgi:hypothetical protein
VWKGEYGMAVFLGIWGTFVISGVDNVLKPYLISRGGNLPLVIVLLGVFGGLLAFGFIGLFIGPTLLAVGYSLLLDWSRTAQQPQQQLYRPLRAPAKRRYRGPQADLYAFFIPTPPRSRPFTPLLGQFPQSGPRRNGENT